MDDPLDQLKAGLTRHTPPARDAAREAALRAAMENFSTEVQGSADKARHTPDQPQKVAGFWTGVTTMLTRLTTPRALMGTTALATCAVAVLIAQSFGPENLLGGDDYVIREPVTEEADVLRDAGEVGVPPQTLELTDEMLREGGVPVPEVQRAPAPLARSRVAAEPAEPPVALLDDAPEEGAAAAETLLQGEPATPDAVAVASQLRPLEIKAYVSSDVLGILKAGDRIDLYWSGHRDGQPVVTLLGTELEVTRFSVDLSRDDYRLPASIQEIEINVSDQLYDTISEAVKTGSLAAEPSEFKNMARKSEDLTLNITEQDLHDDQKSADAEPAPQIDPLDGMLARSQRGVGSLLRERRAIAEENTPPQLAPVAPSDAFVRPEADTEAYPQAEASPIKRVVEEPVSTFSIDVDTASYGVMRSSLQGGHLPPKGSVRVEELVNYFDYAYPGPERAEMPFMTSVSVAETPWNPDTQLLHIGIQGYEDIERPALNLVFLIDTSGSMGQPNKLPLLVSSFKLLVESLRPEDSIAIVTYAGSAGMALAPTPASEQGAILAALDRLGAGGSTAGQAGLQQAYTLAENMAEEGEISRVILATDGDFNVGLSNPEALKDFIADKRESGTYLSVLGFGRGNYDDATMQALAQNGNGTAAYIDTLAEAQKVLVEDMTANLFPIAGDVKIQIEFNPAQISEYRLIGYETRALNREDFNNDAVDAGEIGAGHTVTALYEITPKGSPAERFGDLRYAQAVAEEEVNATRELAFLKLRYKRPGETRSTLIETAVTSDRADIPAGETAFAASVAAFGQLLRGDATLGDFGYREALALASANRGPDPFGYRSEFMSLVRLADALD